MVICWDFALGLRLGYLGHLGHLHLGHGWAWVGHRWDVDGSSDGITERGSDGTTSSESDSSSTRAWCDMASQFESGEMGVERKHGKWPEGSVRVEKCFPRAPRIDQLSCI